MKNLTTFQSNWNTNSAEYFELVDRPHKRHLHETTTDIVLPRGNAPIDALVIPKVLTVNENSSMKDALNHILHEPIEMLMVTCDKNVHNVCDFFEKAEAALPPNKDLVIPFKAQTTCQKCEMKCAKFKHFKLVG